MSEEGNEKTCEQKETCAPCAKGPAKVVIGIALIVVGLWAMLAWLPFLFGLIKGFIGLALVAAGAITIAIAKE